MNRETIEVEIDHGRIFPRGSQPLPEKGLGLLTLLPDSEASGQRASISGFIAKWAGEFSLPYSLDEDSRLTYLLGKHVR